MQSYEHHIVQESLSKRHPYLQEPFTSEIDPTQITVAYFDRTIPKFMDVLLQPDLDHVKCSDALKTLNELAHHHETMDKMIDHQMLETVANLLKHPDWQVREQSALLLAQFAHAKRARDDFDYAFPKLQDLLEDKILKVREAVALCFHKLSKNDDGCQRVVESKCTSAMIHSFIKHSKDAQSLKQEDGTYLIHLLEAFVNLTFSDYGIQPLLGEGAVSNFNTIISSKYVGDILSQEHKQKVQELSLRVLGNISINHDGKQECIDDKVILNAWKYLDSTIYEERLNASLVLMSCTIHLNGKQQAVWYEEVKGEPKIIQKIIERLYEKQNHDLRKNLKVALINIAELPEGFLKITHELSDKMDLLDEVFGARSVKALHNLLPKLTDYHDPLRIDNKDIASKYMRYVKSLAYIIKKYKEEAVQVAIDETINFSEKLAPFLNPETQLQKETVLCLREVCSIDAYNCHILKQFIHKYGEFPIKRESQNNITTIRRELSQYADLLELSEEAQILT